MAVLAFLSSGDTLVQEVVMASARRDNDDGDDDNTVLCRFAREMYGNLGWAVVGWVHREGKERSREKAEREEESARLRLLRSNQGKHCSCNIISVLVHDSLNCRTRFALFHDMRSPKIDSFSNMAVYISTHYSSTHQSSNHHSSTPFL